MKTEFLPKDAIADEDGDFHPMQAYPPFADAKFIKVTKGICPECNTELEIAGARGSSVEMDEGRLTYAAALCTSCNAHVGTIKVIRETLFGLEEDNAVLFGRARVY